MLISESLNAAINAQVGHEFENHLQYLAIAAYFEAEALFGLAGIYKKQAEEEHEHATKLMKFVIDAQGKSSIPAVAAPRCEFGSAEEAVKLAYDTELKTTDQINGLMAQASSEKNYIAMSFLQWFVSEQLEEVSSAEDRLSVVRRAGPSILMVEAYLAHMGQTK